MGKIGIPVRESVDGPLMSRLPEGAERPMTVYDAVKRLADILLAGDERAGEEVFCTYCGAPCRLTAPAQSEDCEVEEDF